MTGSPRVSRFPLALDRVQVQPGHQAQQATQDAARQPAPAGLGMDSVAVRRRMVQRLRVQGLRHEPVLQAMAQVERHRFVDSALAGQAYEDTSLPIGLSQTISKPSVVAHMLALLFEGTAARESGHLGRVLEIGTGCGYQAALLALLGREVISIERLQPLHDKAHQNLRALCLQSGNDLRLVHGDGQVGHAPRAPYQSIIAAAGGSSLPPAWLDQLAVGGRLVAPLFDAQHGGQVLCVVDRSARGLATQRMDAVCFVPLKSGSE